MRTRKAVLLAVAWIVSLAAVATWAQGSQWVPTTQIKPGDPIGPVITEADDIGFQPKLQITDYKLPIFRIPV